MEITKEFASRLVSIGCLPRLDTGDALGIAKIAGCRYAVVATDENECDNILCVIDAKVNRMHALMVLSQQIRWDVSADLLCFADGVWRRATYRIEWRGDVLVLS